MDPGQKKKRASYQDVIDAPEHMIAEIINGELHLHRPKGPATSVATVLSGELGPPFGRGRGGPGGWIILVEPELHLPDGDVLVPDLAGWRRERMPMVTEGYFEIAPDWACEVLSKSTEKTDRTQKMKIYAASGVRHLWLVDPRLRMLEAYRLQDGKWLQIATASDHERVRIEPFEAIELELGTLWADLPLRAGEEPAEYEYTQHVTE